MVKDIKNETYDSSNSEQFSVQETRIEIDLDQISNTTKEKESKIKKSGKKSGRPSSGKTGKTGQRNRPSSAKRGSGRVATGKKTQGSKKT